jgi:hypothetical protein
MLVAAVWGGWDEHCNILMYIVKKLFSTSLLLMVYTSYWSTPVKMIIDKVYLEVTIVVRTPHTVFTYINVTLLLSRHNLKYTDLTIHFYVSTLKSSLSGRFTPSSSNSHVITSMVSVYW